MGTRLRLSNESNADKQAVPLDAVGTTSTLVSERTVTVDVSSLLNTRSRILVPSFEGHTVPVRSLALPE